MSAAVSIPAAEAGCYPVRTGNAIAPLIDGVPAFTRICQAVERARVSVWLTVAFLDHDFRMPGEFGSLFDVLDKAARRGLDVRALFWRCPELDDDDPGKHFAGTGVQRRWLAHRGAAFLARWDRLPSPHCHHQKSWLIDAGATSEVAFVGGINLDLDSISSPGHPSRERRSIHDVYLELRGPAATDVNHNFVQRWNHASERGRRGGSWPNFSRANDLRPPVRVSPAAGDVTVQVSRTVQAGHYRDATATPGGHRFHVADGERSVLEHYLAAIDGATRTIYIEDQLIASPELVVHLYGALARGVEIVYLVPGEAHPDFAAARQDPSYASAFMALDALRDRKNFLLAGIASNDGNGGYHDIYVHSKLMLVDDEWATVGSANVATRSFHSDTELNVSVWDRAHVKALRCALLSEHLGRSVGALARLDDRAAMALFRRVAVANQGRRERGQALAGLAFAIDPARYGHE